MKIVIEIRDELLSKLKYVLLVSFILMGIGFVYFTQLPNINEALIEHGKTFLLVATIFAIYMAINLGANDVANNMGPAVGSKALTLGGAIFLAIIFEASGALIAGGDVVNTIKGGIINKEMIASGSIEFIAIMLSTLLGAALWVNIATFFKAPVSITHAIFGGLIGAGITSAGFSVVNWGKVGEIAGAWIIAILAGGLIATSLFMSIRRTILKRKNMGEAAKHWVPIYVGLMSGIFASYLIMKGFKHKLISSYNNGNGFFDFLLKEVHKIDPITGKEILKYNEAGEIVKKIAIDNASAIFIGVLVAILIYLVLIMYYKSKKNKFFEDNKIFVNTLFNVPLILAVCLLSFAHGANDVANAIGPLAGIYEATVHAGQEVSKSVPVPFWIMLIGATSLSLGLGVFGGRLIKTVGNEITKLDQIKAYCVALSAAITVIIASAMSLPVSTTQIAIGGVFGIGLFREYLKRKKGKEKIIIKKSMIKGIILSWIITLPIAGIISSITYLIVIGLSK